MLTVSTALRKGLPSRRRSSFASRWRSSRKDPAGHPAPVGAEPIQTEVTRHQCGLFPRKRLRGSDQRRARLRTRSRPEAGRRDPRAAASTSSSAGRARGVEPEVARGSLWRIELSQPPIARTHLVGQRRQKPVPDSVWVRLRSSWRVRPPRRLRQPRGASGSSKARVPLCAQGQSAVAQDEPTPSLDPMTAEQVETLQAGRQL